MTQRPLTLIRLAAEYGLKTLDADIAAKKLGLNLRRGAAIVRPWQEELLRPELAKMAGEDYIRRIRMAKYIESYRRGYEDEYENDNARLGFSNDEMNRQLKPTRKRMQGDENTA
ncbi:hypothetical protein ACJH6H_29315 [Mycobacterium sp. SMC-21]|uniref:hypothetical protein n=1 Tax=Mycobacterium sp. SMC-21 TaxID=3381632 RepID=UPI0038763886